MTTDGICAMGRTYDLEDASAYINTDRIAEPFDWPDWDDRHDIVAELLAEGADGNADDDFGGGPDGGPSTLSSAIGLAPKKPASADDKILTVLKDTADPLGIDVNYLDKDAIAKLTGLEGSTLDNALSRLYKAGKIHRPIEDGKEVRGKYAHGPAPALEQKDDA
jgi:DNA-binding transcriptional ArsR family regulator